ncbi:TonB-dependent siderophore receptor [Comamonas sp. NLF-1-9]|uniref:TonB-dependent receptor n=1 Tax=Comamonas sp. NLF-1-9 TaxID=2853163 RepID=UPI001C45A206|nr:TonB-dependent receptor [Comamonas sp. NLF-1-9]QXL83586.1 TonB-dependent receptor [Comamonas sp. NLF-1-9]
MSQRSSALRPSSLRLASRVAAGLSAAALLPVAAHAQAVASGATLPTVTVQEEAIDPNPNAEVGAPYKAKTSADVRHTKPLAETPQTISVITSSAIEDSGQTDLKQILATQPGITLGTGENGNAFGDRYIIRGQEARSDVFVDGLRDPGMTTRESFAVEQVEVTKGPNSSFAGRGSAGGAVNLVTKQATTDMDFTRINAGVGTDSHYRLTGDTNRVFTDSFALRANALLGSEGVPGRSGSKRERNGLALSGLWTLTPDLSINLDYYGLRAKDKRPDLGYFLVGDPPNRRPASRVPLYAQDQDFIASDVDTLTARINYQINPELKLISLTRYGSSKNGYGTTGASMRDTVDAAGNVLFPAITLDGGHTGWQDVSYFAHQSNLRWDADLAGMLHAFIFGIEYTDHRVLSGNYGIANTRAPNCRTRGRDGSVPAANNSWCITGAGGALLSDQLGSFLGRSYTRQGWQRDWRVKTTSLYVMDTVDIDAHWSAFGGLRADHYRLSMPTRNNLTGASTGDYGFSDTLVNGHLGVSYKLNAQGMVYASMGSAQDINGGEPDTGTSSGYGGLVVYNGSAAGARPETSINLEIGTKWNLLDDKLLATAALFQSTKRDVMEGADYGTTGTFNTGKNRVRGVEFALAGNLTPRLQLQAGVALMQSRVLASSNAANVGLPLSNFANRSAVLQGKYQLTPELSLGAAARYESGRCGGQPDTGADYANGMCRQPVPGFSSYDLFASYRFNKHASLRLNVLNVTNKDYFTAVYRSGAFLYKGDGRSARLTLDIEL